MATEEAVLIVRWRATDATGRDGRTIHARPRDRVLAILTAHGRLAP